MARPFPDRSSFPSDLKPCQGPAQPTFLRVPSYGFPHSRFYNVVFFGGEPSEPRMLRESWPSLQRFVVWDFPCCRGMAYHQMRSVSLGAVANMLELDISG